MIYCGACILNQLIVVFLSFIVNRTAIV